MVTLPFVSVSASAPEGGPQQVFQQARLFRLLSTLSVRAQRRTPAPGTLQAVQPPARNRENRANRENRGEGEEQRRIAPLMRGSGHADELSAARPARACGAPRAPRGERNGRAPTKGHGVGKALALSLKMGM